MTKVFLKISQYSRKTPVLESLFNKVTSLKRLQQRDSKKERDSNTGVFL